MSQRVFTLIFGLILSFGVSSLCPTAVLAKPAVKSASVKAESAKQGKSKPQNKTERMKAATESIKLSTEALKKEQFASALAHCRDAMAVAPELKEVPFICAQLMDRNDLPDEALGLVKTMLKDDEKWAKDFDLCLFKATLETKVGQYAEAAATYEQCEAPNASAESAILGNLAEIEMIVGHPDKAIAIYEEAIALDPKNPHAIFGQVVAWVRDGDMARAQARFFDGVAIDPKLTFFDSAFFVPEGELWFHRAVMDLFSHRVSEAAFDLDQYISKEHRSAYREIAVALRDSLATDARQRVGAWPVVLGRVQAVAYREGFIAFADQKSKSVWLLDTGRGTVTERVRDVEHVIGMAFDAYSGALRVLTPERRYVVDPASTGYTYYDVRPEEPRWVGITTDGSTVLGVNAEKMLVSAPFMNVYAQHGIVMVPNVTRHVALSDDKSVMFLETNKLNLFVDIPSDKLLSAPLEKLVLTSISSASQLFAVGLVRGALVFNGAGEIVDRIGSVQDQPVSALAFDATGKYLLTVSGTLAELWRLQDTSTRITGNDE